MFKLTRRPRRTVDESHKSRTYPQFFRSNLPAKVLTALGLGTALVVAPLLTPAANNVRPVAAAFAVAGLGLSGDIAFTIPTETVISGSQMLGAPTQAPKQLRVTATAANLRSGPSTKHKRLAQLKQGTILKLLASQTSWHQVSTSAGVTGWIAAKLVASHRVGLQDSDPVAQPAPNTTLPDNAGTEWGRNVAQIALGLVGRAYRYGAAGPRAFDCSGLTMFVYAQAGVAIPHSSKAQYRLGGQRIPNMADLQPGDLVFFANTAGRGISHTAIYVGGGKMVTANSPRQGVQLSRITDSYWRAHWAGGLRVGR